MRSPCSLALAAWLALLILAGSAPAAAPDIPSPTGPVTDQVGVLDAAARQALTQLIQEVHDRTTAEIAILIVPSTAPETIEEYAVAVFDRWKIGQRGKDNGLLFLVATQDRRLRITTGYGLEGVLPDGKVGEIRDREILPLFRAGRYSEGILRGTQALATVLLGQSSEGAGAGRPTAGPARRQGRSAGRHTGVLLGIFILLVLFAMTLSAMDRPAALSRRAGGGRRRGFWGPWGTGGGIGGGLGGWSGGGGGWSGGGFSSGSFGGFGGGDTGGGGAGGSW
ncbi:MAG TPA: TPM domain-containing protein [Candidatus Methylomirabilis sp.]|nr:TPM domain-containing protein [Candidatus Methylomirabilis sp.]